MPNPKAIDVPQLGFSDEQKDVLHIMMNKEEWDYSTINEIARMEELHHDQRYAPAKQGDQQ